MKAARSSVATEPVTLYLGGIYASSQPTIVKTLLGSCIAVCLWDPAGGGGNIDSQFTQRVELTGDTTVTDSPSPGPC